MVPWENWTWGRKKDEETKSNGSWEDWESKYSKQQEELKTASNNVRREVMPNMFDINKASENIKLPEPVKDDPNKMSLEEWDNMSTLDKFKQGFKAMISGDDSYYKKIPTAELQRRDVEKQSDSKVGSAVAGLLNSLSLGTFKKAAEKQNETLKDLRLAPGADVFEESEKKHPVMYKGGEMAGYLLPYAGAEKAVAPLTKALTKNIGSKLGKEVVKGAVAGGTLDTVQGLLQGDDADELLKRVAVGAGTGVLADLGLNAAGKGIKAFAEGAFPKWRTSFEETLPEAIKEPLTMRNKYRIKNTQLEKAVGDYDSAIETIQNYFKHHDLTPEEVSRIKPELGIDLDSLVKNVEKYQDGFHLNEVTEDSLMPYAAGVKETPKKLTKAEIIKPELKLPEVPNSTVSDSLTPGSKVMFNNMKFTLGNKGLDGQYDLLLDGKPILAASEENIRLIPGENILKNSSASAPVKEAAADSIENESVRQLRAEKNKLIRDYVDLVNDGKVEHAERLNTRIAEIDDILGEKSPLPDQVAVKDKGTLFLNRETFDRNLEDVFGEEANNFKNLYSEPIKIDEAESVRFKNDLRDQVKKLNLSAQESELVQKIGENKMSLEEIKNLEGVDWKKVSSAVDHFKSTYKTLLDKANEVLTKNGYRPIAERGGYFPHFEELNPIMEALGIQNSELPTDINGLTADFAPGKSFFGNALRRKGDKTVYDAVRGFDNYIEGISKVIYHTDNIQRIRSLERDIRTIYKDKTELTNFVSYLHEYGNKLAGKQNLMDRGLEGTVGRPVYKFLDLIRRQAGANMVGANISSALTNFIPLTQAMATTNKFDFGKGLMEAFKNSLPGMDDGFYKKSDYLTRRFGSDKLYLTKVQKVTETANSLFKVVDKFVSESIVRGKYHENLAKGLPEKQALKEADRWAAKLMADRSLGQSPLLFNSKVWGTVFQFQLEVNNQVSFLFKDLPREYLKNGVNAKSAAALASVGAQTAVISYLFNNLYEKAIGRRPAFDPIGVIEQASDDFNNPELDEKKASGNLINNIKDQLPFASTLTGGRMPISSLLPEISAEADPKKEASKLLYLLMPTGAAQLNKTVKGIKTMNEGGVYNADNSQLMYPVEDSPVNAAKALLLGPSSLKESREYYDNGRKPLSKEQTKEFEKLAGKGYEPQKVYDKFIDERNLSSSKSEIDKLAELYNLSKAKKGALNNSVNGVVNSKDVSEEDKIKMLRLLAEKLKAQGGIRR